MKEFDLIIIGGGTAGFSAAIKASEFGVKTAMIEKGVIGGTCVNVGCVPSKRMLKVADTYYYGDHGYNGIKLKPDGLDFNSIVRQKDEVVIELRKSKYSNVLDELPNVTFIKGSARFVSKDRISVDGEVIRGKKILDRHRFFSSNPCHRRNRQSWLHNKRGSSKPKGAPFIFAGYRGKGLSP